MTPKAWFKMIDPESDWDKVPLEGVDDVADLKEAIKTKMRPEFDNYSTTRITISATKEVDDAHQAMKLDGMENLQSVLVSLGVESPHTIEKAFAENVWLFISVPTNRPTVSHYPEQTDPWARYRNRLQSIKESSSSNPGDYADPKKILTLPFPAVGFLPEDRFEFDNKNFRYFGRAKFTELWDGVIQLEERWGGELFFYGTAGYGKSHILAALACLLIRQDKRVVYLPDCRTMLRGFVPYIMDALLLAFGDSPAHQEQVRALRTERDITLFLEEYSLTEKLYFIVDQLNALEVDDDGPDRIDSKTKRQVSASLNGFTFRHCRIQSASPNYQTFHHMERKQTGDCRIAAHGGFSEPEMKEWWDRNSNLDLGGYTKEEIEDATGSIPLLLDSAVADGKKFMISAPELIKVEEEAQLFFDKMCRELVAKPEDLNSYFSMMRACILKRTPGSYESKFCDHRYFYVWRPEGRRVGSYVCGIARDAVTRKLRQRHSTNALEAIWLQNLGKFAHNRIVTGFLVEEACLFSIALQGLKIGMELASGITTVWFSSDFPVYRMEPGATLYCPVRCNYPAIDALIVRLLTKKKKVILFPIQITIAKGHSDSVQKFFTRWNDWLQGLDGYDVDVHFCWITNKEPYSNEEKAGKTHPGRDDRGNRVIYPGHTIHQIPIRLVNGHIADRLEIPGAFPPKATTLDSSPAGPAGEGDTGPLGSTDPTADHKGEASVASAAGGGAGKGKGKAAAEGEVKNKRKKRVRRK